MNSFTETLNLCGQQFLNFAWPMLWQSSLLILILFALEFLLRRKIRASLRYALWLVVLLKLILPPSLALPTNPAWWIHSSIPPTHKAQMPAFTVTYDNPMPNVTPPIISIHARQQPAISFQAWILFAASAISVGLLAWLCVRWLQIVRKVRRVKTSGNLIPILDEARRLTGLRSDIRLKLTEDSMSPAVCGLLRPVILLPQSLVEKLSPEQLRAVLLHEAIHLRRGDVWVNCAQALLQIFYWWHPLLWLANARIRRVREEAVDDAVMFALRDNAEIYAPTLLEVAKLAFNRPLASLGLVGILESRSALRQRIERLINFSAPKKAGLTFLSLCGIFIFSAVALPMGEGPSPIEDQSVSAPMVSAPTPIVAEKTILKTQILITTHFYWMGNGRAEKVMSDLKLNSSADDSSWLVSPQKFNQVDHNLRASSFSENGAPRVVTLNHETATISITKGTNGIYINCTPIITNGFVNLVIHSTVNEDSVREQFDANPILENRGGIVFRAKKADEVAESNLVILVYVEINPTNFNRKISQASDKQLVQDGKQLYEMGWLDEAEAKLQAALKLNSDNAGALYYLKLINQSRLAREGHTNIIYTSKGRQAIVSKLDRIRLDDVSFDNLPLSEVISNLHEQTKLRDPDGQGINFLINPNIESTALNSATGLLEVHTAPTNGEAIDLNSVIIKINPAMNNVRLADVLDAIVKAADRPMAYSVQDYGIVFSPKSPEILYSRHFKITDPDTFFSNLRRQIGLSSTNIQDEVAALRKVFSDGGVDFTQSAKSVFYNDRLNEVFTRATERDLDTIEKIIERLNSTPVSNRSFVPTRATTSVPFVKVAESDLNTVQAAIPALQENVRPQIHIKARFIEVPTNGLVGFIDSMMLTNNAASQITGILTDKNFKTALEALRENLGVETLAEPEALTTSGRQVEMRATTIISVVTKMVLQKTNNASSIIPQVEKIETGPVLDTIANVLSDGYTIDLKVTPSMTKFLGYDQPPTNAVWVNGIKVPVVLPSFQIQKMESHIKLYDGQTVVLGGFQNHFNTGGKELNNEPSYFVKTRKARGEPDPTKKQLLVFVTLTIVDAAGNPVHSDDEMSFAQNSIPPQN